MQKAAIHRRFCFHVKKFAEAGLAGSPMAQEDFRELLSFPTVARRAGKDTTKFGNRGRGWRKNGQARAPPISLERAHGYKQVEKMYGRTWAFGWVAIRKPPEPRISAFEKMASGA
jgi:hypothetical protein